MSDRHLCDEYTEACFRYTYERPIPRDWEQCEQCEGWFETLEEGDVCEDCAECCGGCDELFNPLWLSPSITIGDAFMCDECLEEEKAEVAWEKANQATVPTTSESTENAL